MATADQTPAWEITAQVQTTDLGPSNAYVDGVKVTFRTRSGAVGSVFIPNADYTVETVRAKVSAVAATMETVAGLQG